MDRYSRLEEIFGVVMLVDWLSVMLVVGLAAILALLVD